MEERDFQKQKEELLKGLKRPIPENLQQIKNRYLWLTIACGTGCNKALKLFQKQLKINNDITLNNDEIDSLLFEMHILVLTKGLLVVTDILHKHLPSKKEELDDMISDCEIDCFVIMERMYQHSRKSREDIFNAYEEYSWLDKPNPLKGQSKSKFIEEIHSKVRKFSRIDDDTTSQEDHFALRIKKEINRIDKTVLIDFAKKHITIQGLLLAMDAFAAVEQDKIDSGVREFFNLFKDNK